MIHQVVLEIPAVRPRVRHCRPSKIARIPEVRNPIIGPRDVIEDKSPDRNSDEGELDTAFHVYFAAFSKHEG